MSDFEKLPPKQQMMAFWVIWFAILSGLFVMPFFAPSGPQGGTGIPPKPEAWSTLSVVALVLVSLGILCRVTVLPRIRSLQGKLPAMVVGLALCEACVIIAIFVVDHQLPREKINLFWASAIAVLIYAPVYARTQKASPFHQS